jgi:hypothetical protein
MSRITVFHDGKVLVESEDWIDSKDLPKGSYVYDARGPAWYRVVSGSRFNGAMGVNEIDIPNWIKAWRLILS